MGYLEERDLPKDMWENFSELSPVHLGLDI
jgi:hypothetical protein